MKVKTLALAALLAVNANIAKADIQLFNKFYVGGGVNASWARFDALHDSSELPDDPAYSERINDKSDFGAGAYAQMGKDWALNDSWVAGVVLDYTQLNNKQTGREQEDPQYEYIKFNTDRMVTLRAKLGYLIGDRTLMYGTAGLANYRTDFTAYNDLDSNPESARTRLNATNLVFGGGFVFFTPASDNLSINLEVLHYKGGEKKTFNEYDLTLDTDTGDYAKVKGNTMLRLGLNLAF